MFIKDMAYYIVPPRGEAVNVAPSLSRIKRGVGTAGRTAVRTGNDAGEALGRYIPVTEPENPTVVPRSVLEKFHFTFLIRHPRSSIPSYYRCTVPPLDEVTGFYNFMPSEAGYDELRRLFDYLCAIDQIGPRTAGQPVDKAVVEPPNALGHDICVVDADDLLDNPSGIIEAFCRSVGIEYDENMLKWDTDTDHQQAEAAFAKWPGFHGDAMNSSGLNPRTHVCMIA